MTFLEAFQTISEPTLVALKISRFTQKKKKTDQIRSRQFLPLNNESILAKKFVKILNHKKNSLYLIFRCFVYFQTTIDILALNYIFL